MKTCKVDDFNISYIEEGKGQDVLFLHGWGQNKYSFSSTFDALSKNYHVWSIDFLGHGDSDEPKDYFTVYDYANVLEQFIKLNKIKNPIIISHSFGTRIALIYNTNHKSKNKFVITGGAGIKPKRSLKYHLSVINYKIMKFLVKTPLYSHYKSDLYSNSGSEDYKNATPAMRQVLINVVNEDLTFLIDEIENDTLLYWGEQDDMTPLSDALMFDKKLKKSKLIVKQNSGHFAFLENELNFNEEIEKFLKK